MFGSIILLCFLPWLDRSPVRSARFRPVYKWFFWILVVDSLILGWVGANPPDGVWHGLAFVTIGRVATAYYFAHFLIILPLLSVFERPDPLPHSISEPVLQGGGRAAAHGQTMERA
jgi:quinol-cytochrome oxidoreductase complex cytochrome b subunit